MLPFKNLVNVTIRALKEYGKDDGGNLSAALAFAAFFSIFPLILFLVSLASFFVDPQTARQWVLQNVSSIGGGGSTADFLSKTATDVINARQGAGTWIATIIGLVGLLFSASNVFGTMETAVNRAWGCTKAGSLIKDKALAFGMVLGIGLVLFLSTVIAGILNGIQTGTAGIIGDFPWLWQIVNILVSIALMTGVLTLLFHTVPRCKVHWADVWPGALLTAILWQVLQQAFGFYVGHFTNYQAVYGALGSVIAIQTLLLFACQILIIGAEFTSEYATERESLQGAQAQAKQAQAARERQAVVQQRAAAREQAAQAKAASPARAQVQAKAGQADPTQAAAVVGAAAALAAALGLLTRGLGRRSR